MRNILIYIENYFREIRIRSRTFYGNYGRLVSNTRLYGDDVIFFGHKRIPSGISFIDIKYLSLCELKIIPRKTVFKNIGHIYLNKNVNLKNLSLEDVFNLSEKLPDDNKYLTKKY